MADGTSLPTIKNALITTLQARAGLADVNVAYSTPEVGSGVVGPTGLWKAIWVEAAQTAAIDVNVMRAGKLWLDESYRLIVPVQVIATDGDTSAYVCDQAATVMLGEVFEAVATDVNGIQLGVTNGSSGVYAVLIITPGGWAASNNPLPPNLQPGCRFDAFIDVQCRFN